MVYTLDMDNQLTELAEQCCEPCEQRRDCMLLDKFSAVLQLSSEDCSRACGVWQWLRAYEQVNRI